jgi:hypothetical protein
VIMRIHCVRTPVFSVDSLSLFKPLLTRIQFDKITMIATALVLGARFKLGDFRAMWKGGKSVSPLSTFSQIPNSR